MAKERISLTLDADLVERLDRRIAREGISNRSKGVESFLEEYLGRAAVRTAVILGGGTESSCLVKINGEAVIERNIALLEDHGVETILVPTADSQVRERLDGRDTVDVMFEEEPRGTAGSLRDIGPVEDTILVMNGDVVCDIDLEDMLSSHREEGRTATVALTTAEETGSYGVIRMKGSTVTEFREKPEDSRSHLVNAGVYLLEPEFIERVPDKTRVDIEPLFASLAEDGELNGYVYDGEWSEIG